MGLGSHVLTDQNAGAQQLVSRTSCSHVRPQEPSPAPFCHTHSRIRVHKHHSQAANAPCQEPLQLPPQTLQVHRLLHLQQVPSAACQERAGNGVRAVHCPSSTAPISLSPCLLGPLTGDPAPGSPRCSTTRSSTSSTSSYSTWGMGTAWAGEVLGERAVLAGVPATVWGTQPGAPAPALEKAEFPGQLLKPCQPSPE